MSIRPVKRMIHAKPTIEGAGVKLQRAFGFGETTDFDPFLLLTTSATIDQRTISPASRGIRTAGSKRSRTSSPGPSRTATVWATKATSARATCSG